MRLVIVVLILAVIAAVLLALGAKIGTYVLTTVGILITIAPWLIKKFGLRGTAADVETQADSLADAMYDQWNKAAHDRRLIQPAALPIRWRISKLPVAVAPAAATSAREGHAPFDPLPGLSHTTVKRLREGTQHDLHSVYGGLASGRLVIAGPAGSGKSAAAILLLLDALDYRKKATDEDRACIPVPVMFTLHGWDPDTTPVRDWLLHKLSEIPGFRRSGAKALFAKDRIAVFLDGLDEINEEIRPTALKALSVQATFRLVLLTRSAELVDAAQHGPLLGAAVIELQPIPPAAAREYLLNTQISPPPPHWRATADELRRSRNSPLTLALSNPLNLTLLRDIWPANEFLDTKRFRAPEDVENHLLDHALEAAYMPRPGQPPPRYTLATAQRTLGYLAHRLNADGNRDLAWWSIPCWTNRLVRMAGIGIGVSIATAIVIYAAAGPRATDLPRFLVAILLGLVAGCAAGYAASRPNNSPAGIPHSWWRGPFTGSGLWLGLPGGLTLALGTGLLEGFVGGAAVWIALGLVVWFTAGLSGELSAVNVGDFRSTEPLQSWRQGHASCAAIWVAWWFIAWFVTLVLRVEPVLGLALALGAMLAAGPLFADPWAVAWTQVELALRYRTPVRLLRFLEDARSRGVLRTVGPVYQFRHAKLQDRLALLSKER